MKFLITGGAGFIGSHIVEELVKQGDEVIVIDNLSTGKLENIKPFLDKIKFIKGDIKNLELLKKEFKNVDYVIHQAALVSVTKSIENPLESHDNTALGTLNVLIAAKECNVKRVIYASSAAVYGDNIDLPLKENSKLTPLSPYATDKLYGEFYCKLFFRLYGLETVCLRYFNVFGPRQDPASPYSGVISIFTNKIVNNETPTIFGDGEQTRDFVFVKDIVKANLLACKKENIAGEVFNIAYGNKVSINEILKKLNDSFNKNLKPIYDKPRKGDIKHSLADTSKAKELLDFNPNYNFENGLKETMKWFQK